MLRRRSSIRKLADEAVPNPALGEEPGAAAALQSWRTTVARHLSELQDPRAHRHAARLVNSDVGPILFPAWDKIMLPAIESNGNWEPTESEWLRARLREGMVALDIGANVGYHVITMARAVGQTGRIVAFEPDPFNFELLRCNLLINDIRNVCTIMSAAGDFNGTTDFTLDESNAGDHRSYRRTSAPDSSVIRVPIVQVDDVLADHRVDFVLTDTQSFDHKVIKGMSRLVQRCHPTMLVEYWTEGLAELGADPAAVIDYYRSLGYEVSVLDDPSFPHDATPQQFVELADAAPGYYVSLVLEAVR
jgi:FkbM family methyltransferase